MAGSAAASPAIPAAMVAPCAGGASKTCPDTASEACTPAIVRAEPTAPARRNPFPQRGVDGSADQCGSLFRAHGQRRKPPPTRPETKPAWNSRKYALVFPSCAPGCSEVRRAPPGVRCAHRLVLQPTLWQKLLTGRCSASTSHPRDKFKTGSAQPHYISSARTAFFFLFFPFRRARALHSKSQRIRLRRKQTEK